MAKTNQGELREHNSRFGRAVELIRGRRHHELRYVLKNKDTGDVFFVVVFTLILEEDLEKQEADQKFKDGAKAPNNGGLREQTVKRNDTNAEDLD